MNLLDMAMGYGDKPKKLPTRPAMWMQGATAPSVSTSTAKVPVGRPTTYDDYVKTSYWDEKGGVHKDYSGNFNTRQNAIVENRLREARDNQGFKDLGGLAARIVSDPFDMVMSGLDYAKGDINGGEFALSMLPFIPGGLGGLLGKTRRLGNLSDFNNIVPEMKALSGQNMIEDGQDILRRQWLDNISNKQPTRSQLAEQRAGADSFFGVPNASRQSILPSSLWDLQVAYGADVFQNKGIYNKDFLFSKHSPLSDFDWRNPMLPVWKFDDVKKDWIEDLSIANSPSGMREMGDALFTNLNAFNKGYTDLQSQVTKELAPRKLLPKDEARSLVNAISNSSEMMNIQSRLESWFPDKINDIVSHIGDKAKTVAANNLDNFYSSNQGMLFDNLSSKERILEQLNKDYRSALPVEKVISIANQAGKSFNKVAKLDNLTFKRGGGTHLPTLDDVDFGNEFGNKNMAGLYATPAENISKAFSYLRQPANIPDEFAKYTDNIDGFMQSFRLNPQTLMNLRRAEYFGEPWGMEPWRMEENLGKGTDGIYNWDKNFTATRGRPNPMDEAVFFKKDTIDPKSWESFPVTKLPDGRVARTIPWVDEGKYVAPALLSPLLLRALQGGNNDHTR